MDSKVIYTAYEVIMSDRHSAVTQKFKYDRLASFES
jgi:hypothetical protein